MPQSNQITAEELASCRRELERRWTCKKYQTDSGFLQ